MLKFQDLANLTVQVIQETKEENDEGYKTQVETEEDIRSREIQKHINYFKINSSLHGLQYVLNSNHSFFRRLVWLIITIAALSFSIQKVHESTVNYLSYPFNTMRTRRFVDKLEFPAVSFCNLNDIRLSKVNNTNFDAAILDNSKRSPITDEEYRNYTLESAHRLDDMLIDCTFNGMKCGVENFTTFFWKQGDRCYSFNSGQEGHKLLYVGGTGIERSLSLTINIEHYDYYRGGMNAGIHLILHGQDETPVRLRGLMVPPGYTSYIQLEKKKILNLKHPYKTQCGSLKLKYFKRYSRHTCWLEQLTDFVYKNCSCKDFFMPGDIRICSLDQAFTCVWPRWEDFMKLKLAKCPVSCEIDMYYANTVSQAVFPTDAYSDTLFSLVEKKRQFSKINPTVNNRKQFTRDNFLRVVVYYDDLSYELIEQKPSYDTLVWLGDIGGQIGLFIGAGAMTYFEFLDCLILVFYTKFIQKFKCRPTAV